MSILLTKEVINSNIKIIKSKIAARGHGKCLEILYTEFGRINYKTNDGLDRTYSMHLAGFQAVIDVVSHLAAQASPLLRPGAVTGAWYKGFSRAMDTLGRQA